MKKPTIRRLFAYLIDILLVSYIASMFAYIPLLNPKIDEYEKAYNEYTKYTESLLNSENTVTLDMNGLSDITYNLSKTGIYIQIISLVFTFLYFTVFAWFNNGQTLGKKLLKIKVISNDKKKFSFKQSVLRTFIVNSLLTTTILVVLISVLSKGQYMNISQYIEILDMALVFGCILFVLFREDGMGLHDLIAGTRVVYVNDLVEDEVKEAVIVEKDETRKRTTKKKVKKNE